MPEHGKEENAPFVNAIHLATCRGGSLLANGLDKEQKQILSVNVTADKNPKHTTDPSNDTTDQVFLLNVKEADQYFLSDEERMCTLTVYTTAQGAYTLEKAC